MSRRVWLLALFLAVLALGLGCDRLFATKIKNILDSPRDYENKLVTVSGTVTETTNLLVYKSFVLNDGSGQIRVVTERMLPKKGSRMTVTATVKEGFSLGDSSSVVLVEKAPDSKQE